jgi:hypothetical protein
VGSNQYNDLHAIFPDAERVARGLTIDPRHERLIQFHNLLFVLAKVTVIATIMVPIATT